MEFALNSLRHFYQNIFYRKAVSDAVSQIQPLTLAFSWPPSTIGAQNFQNRIPGFGSYPVSVYPVPGLFRARFRVESQTEYPDIWVSGSTKNAYLIPKISGIDSTRAYIMTALILEKKISSVMKKSMLHRNELLFF